MAYTTTLFNIDFNSHKATAVITGGGAQIQITNVAVPHTPGETEESLKAAARQAIATALHEAADGWQG